MFDSVGKCPSTVVRMAKQNCRLRTQHRFFIMQCRSKRRRTLVQGVYILSLLCCSQNIRYACRKVSQSVVRSSVPARKTFIITGGKNLLFKNYQLFYYLETTKFVLNIITALSYFLGIQWCDRSSCKKDFFLRIVGVRINN
jgi:hypothetical protein